MLPWVLHKDAVTAPIVSAMKMQHPDEAVAALSLGLGLGPEEIADLEGNAGSERAALPTSWRGRISRPPSQF